MKVSQVFSGDSLKAADLGGAEPTVTIESVEMKKFDSGNKLVISFKGKQKKLVCNKTNANRIAYLYGDDTDGWIGKQITLFTDLVDYQGQTMEAIRIRPPKAVSVAGGTNGGVQHVVTDRGGYHLSEMRPVNDPPPAVRGSMKDELDDPIPF